MRAAGSSKRGQPHDSAAAVPEPGTLVLLGMGVLAYAARLAKARSSHQLRGRQKVRESPGEKRSPQRSSLTKKALSPTMSQPTSRSPLRRASASNEASDAPKYVLRWSHS